MPSWIGAALPAALSSSSVSPASSLHSSSQLAVTAVASAALTACALLAVQLAIPKSNRRHHDSIQECQHQAPTKRLSASDAPTTCSPTSCWNCQQAGLSPEDEFGRIRAQRARTGDYDNDLILEQLSRNRIFLGDPGLDRVRSAFVVVVGVGGVGSHAAAALVRSGIGAVRLIDFDQVTLSSLNRHAVATLADVGASKVETLRRRLEQIAPWCQFDCRTRMFNAESADELLSSWSNQSTTANTFGRPSFVVDAIDNVETKVALLEYCHKHSIPVISSMGAGCKSDPTRIFVADISASSEDPLSRTIRQKLRLAGVSSGIPTVFSTEKSGPNKAQLQPVPKDVVSTSRDTSKENTNPTDSRPGSDRNTTDQPRIGDLAVLPDFRVRILPVLGTLPAIFGLTIANQVLLSLSGYPSEPLIAKSREKLYDGALNLFQACEQKLSRHFVSLHRAGTNSDEKLDQKHPIITAGLRLPLTVDDAGYLIDDIFRSRSVISGLVSRLTLVRWSNPQVEPKPNTAENDISILSAGYVDQSSVVGQFVSTITIDQIVVMTKEEAVHHVRTVLEPRIDPETVYPAAVVDLVRRRRVEVLQNASMR